MVLCCVLTYSLCDLSQSQSHIFLKGLKTVETRYLSFALFCSPVSGFRKNSVKIEYFFIALFISNAAMQPVNQPTK